MELDWLAVVFDGSEWFGQGSLTEAFLACQIIAFVVECYCLLTVVLLELATRVLWLLLATLEAFHICCSV